VFFGFRYTQSSQPSAFEVEYSLTCDQCQVSYKDAEGQTISEEEVSSNWSYRFTGAPGSFAYVSAHSTGEGETVTVQIKVDGQVVAEGASEQKQGLASASKML